MPICISWDSVLGIRASDMFYCDESQVFVFVTLGVRVGNEKRNVSMLERV